MSKENDKPKMGKQYRRAADLPGMGAFNNERIPMEEILNQDIVLLAGKVVNGRQGEFAIFDLEGPNGETRTALCGGENVIRMVKLWQESGNTEPLIVEFGVVETDSGFSVYTVR